MYILIQVNNKQSKIGTNKQKQTLGIPKVVCNLLQKYFDKKILFNHNFIFRPTFAQNLKHSCKHSIMIANLKKKLQIIINKSTIFKYY